MLQGSFTIPVEQARDLHPYLHAWCLDGTVTWIYKFPPMNALSVNMPLWKFAMHFCTGRAFCEQHLQNWTTSSVIDYGGLVGESPGVCHFHALFDTICWTTMMWCDSGFRETTRVGLGCPWICFSTNSFSLHVFHSEHRPLDLFPTHKSQLLI